MANVVRALAALAVSISLASIAFVAAAEPLRIVVSAPGPRNLSYLPIDLIPVLGADREEGVRLRILHTGGGGVALNHLVTRNADFAVAGAPAAMSLKANGGAVVVIAAVNDKPLFVLMVRSGLRGQVRRIRDLKGKVIGVNTSAKNTKTASQQLAELLLRSDGVSPNQVRIVPAGQSWVEQSSLLISGAADAVVGDEPFASRLRDAGQVFFLAHLAEPDSVRGIDGVNFLHAALGTRSDVIARHPVKVEKMVRMLRRSLDWIARHTPEQVVDALGITDVEERQAMIRALRRYPRAFSRDGRFSNAQLKETERFFRAGLEPGMPGGDLVIERLIDDRWVGRRD